MRYATLMIVVFAVLAAACSTSDSTPTTAPDESLTTSSPSSSTTAPAQSTTTVTTPEQTTTTQPGTTTTEGVSMELVSPAFEHGAPIPGRYTCDGDDVSPELRLSGVPGGTIALVLIMDDPDAPGGTWDHWIAYDVEPTSTIPENVGELGTAGLNSWKKKGYGGPCPPSGTHRYVFRVLALDAMLGLDEGADKATVLEATEGSVLAEATLLGTYER